MEVKESEIDEYMKAFKGAGNTVGKFISKNYNRKGVEIIDTGSTTVKRKNNKEGTNDPVITVKTYKFNNYGSEVEILGPSKVIYSPNKPLSCGAKVWIETDSDCVKIDEAS